MDKDLARTLTVALVSYLDNNRPEGTMDCSSGECVSLEKAFTEENFDSVETLIKKKLSRLTEFEKCLVEFYNERTCLTCDKDGVYNRHELEDLLHTWSSKLLALAKKELARRDEVITLNNLSPYDKGFQDGKAEAMADLERTFECNPDKLPKWLKNELTKKHLDGYCRGVITYDANKQPRVFFQEGYEQAEKDLGWISVKDKLPEVGHFVLTCVSDTGTPQCVGMAILLNDGTWWDGDIKVCVDYWMEVPKLNENNHGM